MVFQMDDDGKLVYEGTPDDAEMHYVEEAADGCPVASTNGASTLPQPGGRAVEAWSMRLGRLGRLPTDEGDALAPLLRSGRPGVTGTVSALVPRPGCLGGTRIHIRLEGVD